jgi:predicted nucleotidyltransferase
MDKFLSVPTIDKRERIQSDVIRLLARRIVDRFHPQKIILFGSYAYGQPRPESDVDLLVIMETTLRESQQALQIRQFLNPLFGLDIIVYPPSKIEQRLAWGDFFLREIIEKGIILYESPDA